MQDLYEMLGVPRNADIDTIKAAYRRRAKQSHPDTGGTASDFEILSLARRVLTDQHLRDQYDRTGRADLDSEDTKQQQALSIVQNLLTLAMGKVPRIDIVNLVEVMKADLREAIDGGHAQMRTIQQRIERLEQVRDRFIVVANGKPNRIRALLEGQIRIEQGTIERCRQQMSVHEVARDILIDYGYKTDHAPQILMQFTQAPF